MTDTNNLNETSLGLNLSSLQDSQKTVGSYFTITVIEGHDFGCIFQLEKSETIVGRKKTDPNDKNESIDIQLNDDRTSRRHLLLTKQIVESNEKTFEVFATDTGSKNGSYINGEVLSPQFRVKLKNGDKLQIGDSVLKFEIKDTFGISYQERLYQQATHDPLTGLWNYHYAKQEIEKLLLVSNRYNSVFSLLLIELDFFQSLNEGSGRATGDAVLRKTARIISSQLSDYELVARFSGNQFLALLPDAGINKAVSIGEQLRKIVSETDFSSEKCSQAVTISIGVVQFPVCGKSFEELVKQCDQSLYKAKQLGRNRVQADMVVSTSSKIAIQKVIKVIGVIIVIVGLVVSTLFVYPKINFANKKELIFSGIVESHEIQIGSKVGGRVKDVLIKEGEPVKAGQPAIVFDIADLLAQRSLLEARIKEAEANLLKLRNGFRVEEIAAAEALAQKEAAVLKELRNGPRSQEIEQARADLAAIKAELANSEITFKRFEQVYLDGVVSKQVRDDAEAAVILNKAKVEAAQQKLSLLEAGTREEQIQAAEANYRKEMANAKLLRSGTRSEDIESAYAQLSQIKAEYEVLNVQIAEGAVAIPSDSVVEVISVRPGDLVAPNKPVATLLERSQIWVRIYVPETELGRIHLNQKAKIKIEAFPDKEFSGYVEEISPQGEYIPRNVQAPSERHYQVFGIKVHLDNEGVLNSGMAADVKLEKGD